MTPLTRDTFGEAVALLTARYRPLAAAVDRYGTPPFWHRPPGFAALALLILEQQVSLASAQAVFERLAEMLGELRPQNVLSAPSGTLATAGVTRQKQRYLRELATAIDSGTLDLGDLATRSDDDASRLLQEIPGIGPWTAEVYLLSSLRRPDVWPVGDRALQVGAGEVLEMASPPSVPELTELGERWRPRRSVAARLIWHAYLTRRGRTETVVSGLEPLPLPDGGQGYRPRA